MSMRVSTRIPAPLLTLALSPLLAVGLVALLLAGGASTASADRFDDAAKGATRLKSQDALSALFWSQDVNCAKIRDDFRKRQCKGVRDARRAKISNQTYLVDVAGPAIDIELKPDTMSALITLRACVACEDEGAIVVGKGVHRTKGKGVVAPTLATKTKIFKKVTHLEHWKTYIGSRLRAQFLMKISAPTERFKVGKRGGYKVSVVGYRFYDPCKGSVMAAKPSSKKGPVTAGACEDVPAVDDGTKVSKAPKVVHPDRLSPADIKTAMKEVKVLAKSCHEAYGIEGAARFKIVIANTGKITKSDQSGDFAGTPTGICLDKAVKMAVFPKSKKKATRIAYPISLR